jgi:hypothetical protein
MCARVGERDSVSDQLVGESLIAHTHTHAHTHTDVPGLPKCMSRVITSARSLCCPMYMSGGSGFSSLCE